MTKHKNFSWILNFEMQPVYYEKFLKDATASRFYRL